MKNFPFFLLFFSFSFVFTATLSAQDVVETAFLSSQDGENTVQKDGTAYKPVFFFNAGAFVASVNEKAVHKAGKPAFWEGGVAVQGQVALGIALPDFDLAVKVRRGLTANQFSQNFDYTELVMGFRAPISNKITLTGDVIAVDIVNSIFHNVEADDLQLAVEGGFDWNLNGFNLNPFFRASPNGEVSIGVRGFIVSPQKKFSVKTELE